MPLHELLSRKGQDQMDGNLPSKNHRSRVTGQENNGSGIGQSRFRVGLAAKKSNMVSIPGKKDVRKRRVFENINNQMTGAGSSNQMELENAKRLKKEECNKENRPGKEGIVSKASGKAFLRFASKKDTLSKVQGVSSQEMTVGSSQERIKKKRAKGRPEMPDIPIPKRLPIELIKSSDDLDTLTDAIDNLLCDLPDNVHSEGLDYFSNPVYAQDVIVYLQREEQKFIVNPSFLGVSENADVNPHMRSILIDWLVQVQNHLNLEPTTLHLTVRMLDQFTVKKKVPLSKFQLVGITCLLIASKFEERFAPSIDKLVHLTDGTYSMNEVLQMELVVFRTLGFQVHLPTPVDFMDRFLMCVPVLEELEQQPARLKQVCQYLLDMSLHDIHMVQWSASMVAAATLCLAQYIVVEHSLYSVTHQVYSSDSEDDAMQISIMKEGLGYSGQQPVMPELWTPLLQHFTGYSETDLMPCMMRVAKLLNRVDKSKYQGAHGKYKSNRQFGAVSMWPGLAAPKVKQLVDLQINTTL